jgi:hypothetical protein
MKKTAVLVIAVAVMGLSSPAGAQSPGDSVEASFSARDNGTLARISVHAQSGSNGEAPSGNVEWHSGGPEGPTWSGTVTCLSVDGHRAVIGFSGTYFYRAALFPAAGLIQVADLGGPSSGLDTFEYVYDIRAEGPDSPLPGPLPGPTDCSSFPSFPRFPSTFRSRGSESDATIGDLVVTDVQPAPPISKDECKNGGWRTYGVFKSQGDCVSFVATGGKKPPRAKKS